jgi:hypothetical protein
MQLLILRSRDLASSMIMPFFQIVLLLVMLFELIGSSDNDDDYHRIAIADSKPDNYTQVLPNYTAELQEARGGRTHGELRLIPEAIFRDFMSAK